MAGDFLRDKVPLLLHMNGVNTSTTFVNDGHPAYSSVIVGNTALTTLSTASPKYGSACGSFNGATKRLVISGLNLASQSMVIECWFNPTTIPVGSQASLWQAGADNSNNSIIQLVALSSGSLRLRCTNSSGTTINSVSCPTASILINTWYHIAAVINIESGLAYIYIDGTLSSTTSSFNAYGISPSTFFIGYARYLATTSANAYLDGFIDDFRITYGIDRYLSSFTPPLELPDYADYINVQSDLVYSISIPQYYLSNIELVSDSLSIAHYDSLSTSLEVLDSILCDINDSIQLITTDGIQEYIKCIDRTFLSFYKSVIEGLDVSDSIPSFIFKLESIFNYISTTPQTSSKLVAVESLVNSLKLLDNIERGLSGAINEVIAISQLVSSIQSLIASILSSITINQSLSSSYITVLSLLDSLDIDNTIYTTSIFNSSVLNSIIINIPSISGSDSYLAYLLSPETMSVSTYNNYNFDGCTKFNSKYLFYNKTGLYEYGGKFDNGSSIRSEIETVAFNFNTSNLKNVPSVYLGETSSGPTYLKVRVDGRAEIVYKLNKNTNNLQTQKVDIGKGLIGRYFQFEVITEADDFSLESIEFYPLELRRKL